MEDEVLTVPEVAARLRVSRNMVFDLIRSKQLNSFLIGKRGRRVYASEVRRYLDSCQRVA